MSENNPELERLRPRSESSSCRRDGSVGSEALCGSFRALGAVVLVPDKSEYENPDDNAAKMMASTEEYVSDEYSRPAILNLLGASELFGATPDADVSEYMYAKRGFCVHWLPWRPVFLRTHRMTARTMAARPKTPPTTPPMRAPRDVELDCPPLPGPVLELSAVGTLGEDA